MCFDLLIHVVVFSGAPPNAAAVRAETDQSADQVFGSSVEEEQHEDHECNLPEGATQTTR